MNRMGDQKRPRIFYGWYLLAMASLIAAIGYSMRYFFTVSADDILDEFVGWTRAETSFAVSLSLIIYGVSAPLVGYLVDKLGPRKVLVFAAVMLSAGLLAMSQTNALWQLYLSFGVIMAIGINSMGFPTHYSYLHNWFVLRRGLAFSVIGAGAGVGNVLSGQYQHLISSSLGWRGASIALAAVPIIMVIPLALFFIRRSPQEIGLLPDGVSHSESSGVVKEDRVDRLIVDKEWVSTEWTLGKALRSYRLWCLFFVLLFFSITLNLVLIHQTIHAQDVGFSEIYASSLLSFVGIAMIAGNSFGFLSDRIGREATYTLSAIGVIIGISALMLANVSQGWLLYIYFIFFGVSIGLSTPTFFSASADLFAGKHYGSINGFTLFGFGMGGAIGPWLGGYIFDAMESYTVAFIITAGTIAAASALLWLAAPRKVRLVPGRARKAVKG